MDVVSPFAMMLQEFAVVMTANTLASYSTLVSGWMFAPRRNITSMIVAAGMAGVKHHSSFHRVFATARWSLDAFGLTVFRLIELHLHDDEPVLLSLEEGHRHYRPIKRPWYRQKQHKFLRRHARHIAARKCPRINFHLGIRAQAVEKSPASWIISPNSRPKPARTYLRPIPKGAKVELRRCSPINRVYAGGIACAISSRAIHGICIAMRPDFA